MRTIDRALLDEATALARGSPRRRKNVNFHPADDAPSHRLLNAIEPGSYVAPHRHLEPTKDETMAILRGRLGVVTFEPTGAVARTLVLEPGSDVLGVTLPAGTFHSVVSLAPGTVYLESKAGPYRAPTLDERGAWAPAEQAAGAAAYLEDLVRLFA